MMMLLMLIDDVWTKLKISANVDGLCNQAQLPKKKIIPTTFRAPDPENFGGHTITCSKKFLATFGWTN